MSRFFAFSDLVRTVRRAGLVALLAALTATALPAPAAYAQQARTVTFDEAVRLALEKNIALKRAANDLERQGISVSQERMDFFPTLSLSSSANQNYGRVVDPNDFQIINQTTEFFSANVGTRVNVFNGFADQASLQQARLNYEATDHAYDRSRQTVVFNVMSSYLDLIAQREQIRIREENLEAQRQQLAQIEEFTRVGARPISDLYQQQAAVANAELNVLDAQRLYQVTEAGLIQTLQLDPFGTYNFEAPEIGDARPAGETYQVDQLLRNAYDLRPDLKARSLSISAARQGIRAARAGFFPSVSFSAGYGSDWASGRPGSLMDQFDDRRGGNVGFSIGIPLFDRFTTRNNLQMARVQLNDAGLAMDELQQQVAVQVRQAYLDYRTAEKRLDVTEKQVRAAEQALAAAQERYNVGAATLVELTQARAEYVQAASNRAQADYDFIFRKKLIDYYTGALDPGEPLF